MFFFKYEKNIKYVFSNTGSEVIRGSQNFEIGSRDPKPRPF